MGKEIITLGDIEIAKHKFQRYKNLPTFQEVTFRAKKIKKYTLKIFLVFQEMEISTPKKLNSIFLIIIVSKKPNKTF